MKRCDSCTLSCNSTSVFSRTQIFDLPIFSDVSTCIPWHSVPMLYCFLPPVTRKRYTCLNLSHRTPSNHMDEQSISDFRKRGLVVIFVLFHRPVEAQNQGWMNSLGKALANAATYLPSQVADVVNQGRSFALVRHPFAGVRNICIITK